MLKQNNNTSLSLIPVPLVLVQKLTLKQRHVYEYHVKARENGREGFRKLGARFENSLEHQLADAGIAKTDTFC